MNIVESIISETLPFADKLAVVQDSRSITYRDLLIQVEDLRKLLSHRGIGPGQRIGFRCSDGIDYIIGALALLKCGAAVVPLADSLTHSEIQNTIDRIEVHGILIHNLLNNPIDSDSITLRGSVFYWQPRCHVTDLDSACLDLGAAFIRFSSGTTGASKGVVLSHRSIIDRTDAANRGMEIAHRDVILWVLGMSHHFVVSILLFLRKGATIVVANHDFPFSMLDAALTFPITFIYASPLHYHLLASMDAVPSQAFAKVRLAISTAMKMPPDISDAFACKFGFAPAQAYGIIEVGLPFLNHEVGTGGEATVGRMLPDYQLRIANADADGIGEIFIRGKGMFDAYFSPWRLRAQCLQDGWFQTGDLGRLDNAGRLCLLGRCKTVIVCAGMKVFPEEVEEVINSLEGIVESLVSAQEHPQFGQVPTARIVLADAIDDPACLIADLRRLCCQRLSPYKVPVEFHIVSRLPKTPSGKLARAVPSLPVHNCDDDPFTA